MKQHYLEFFPVHVFVIVHHSELALGSHEFVLEMYAFWYLLQHRIVK
jgi:hypothetical protein